MVKNKNKFNIYRRFTNASAKKKCIYVGILVISTALLTFIGVFAYQVYLENTQPSYHNDTDSHDWECGGERCFTVDKPVIYLYPTKIQAISVRLKYTGKLTTTYPSYNNDSGWLVTAYPDGTLTNKADGQEYSYLFWEGIDNTDYSSNTGFVVKGSDSKDFLQHALAKLGLTPREYNEMIVFWLPKMEKNRYNLIHFAGKEYTDNAQLLITPKPDSILRVFMVFKPLGKIETVKAQQLNSFERKGFTVVEWGGTERR